MVVFVVRNAIAHGVDYVAQHFSMLSLKKRNEILLAEIVIIHRHTFHLLVLPYTFGVERASEVSYYGGIEGHLSQLVTSVCIGLQKNFCVRLYEHPHGELFYAKKNLCGRLVLSVKYFYRPRAIFFTRPPRKGNV